MVDALEDLGLVQVDASRTRYTTMIRGEKVVALDISNLPGQIDWLIRFEFGACLDIEVKEYGKEGDLTDGEKSWRDDLGLLIASNKDTVRYAILENIMSRRV